ncbi:MAG: mechanosensitive ion channel protein MscS [Elusimicrobia bacterium]|nr:MAG: mechanosensitive ion channel protein MscS [Elusimicrobiota bacterium]
MEQIRAYEELILAYLKTEFLGISIQQALVAFAFIFGGFLLRKVVERFFAGIEKAVSKTETPYDDLLLEIVRYPLLAACVPLGFYFALHTLPLPTKPVDFSALLSAGFKTITVIFVVWVAIRFVDGVCSVWEGYAKRSDSEIDDMLVPIVRKSLKSFLVIVGGILTLQNMGYSVGSLLAGFGLGGMAFALAAKDSISNIFGSIVIFWDRPFKTGDWIQMGDIEGTVEEIGIRTTRVRTFANSQLTIPNAKWTTSAINNWSRMKKRRISTTIGLTYDTKPAQMEKILEAIKELIRKDEALRDDFFLVNFKGFGSHSMDIFIYCFTVTTQWKEFLDVRQRFFLNIAKEVESAGLEFAFPTQTLHVAKPAELAKSQL